MKKILYGIALSLLSSPCFGAWGNLSTFASSKTFTSSAIFNVTTSSTIHVGEVGVCVIAVNNDGNGTDTDDISTSSDSVGNTWTMAGESEYDPGAPAAGAAVGIIYSLISTELSTSGTITVNFGAAQTAKAVSCQKFSMSTPGAGQSRSVVQVSTVPIRDEAGADAGTMGFTALENSEHLIIRAVASETTNGEIGTLTSSFTRFRSETHSTGTESTSMGIGAEFRIVTATFQSSDPTMSDTTADRTSAMVALDESVVASRGRFTVVP